MLALAVAVVLVGVAWLASHRTVTLVVDGQVETVETHAATVGELLERAGVDVGPDDRVDPDPDSAVVDGMRVEVVHARAITLLIGDEAREVVVAALTVADALEELSGDSLPGDTARRSLVRPSRLSRVRGGMVVELSDPVALTVILADQQRDVITDEALVGDVLARLGLELGPNDRVAPAPDRPVEQGMVVVVERVEIREEIREESVAYPTEERRTEALLRGERREAQAGQEGVVRIVEEVTLVDGVEESRRTLAEDTIREPRPRIVEVGTAAPPPEPEPAPERREPAAPGNPANVEEGKASWYDNPYGGYTAAHRSIPRGTIVTVTNLANGRSVKVRINDRGPFVDGRIIDLNRKAFAELAAPTRGVVRVRIEW